jgi:hypothetical protein
VGYGGLGWIELVQDRGKWQALVNAVMTCSVYKIGKNEMGGLCSSDGGQERRVQVFDWET